MLASEHVDELSRLIEASRYADGPDVRRIYDGLRSHADRLAQINDTLACRALDLPAVELHEFVTDVLRPQEKLVHYARHRAGMLFQVWFTPLA